MHYIIWLSLKAIEELTPVTIWVRVERGSDDLDNLGHLGYLGHFLEGQVGFIQKINYLDVTRIYHIFFRQQCWV